MSGHYKFELSKKEGILSPFNKMNAVLVLNKNGIIFIPIAFPLIVSKLFLFFMCCQPDP